MFKINFNPGDLIFVNEDNVSKFNVLNFYIGKPFIYLKQHHNSYGHEIYDVADVFTHYGEIITANMNYFKKL